MNADDMPAGREMDVLVAERVMGLSLEHLPAQYMEGVTRDGEDGWEGFYCPRCGVSQSEYASPCAKCYSTDLEAAWEILWWAMRNEIPNFLSRGSDGWFVALGEKREYFTIVASTAKEGGALAICRAALKYVMEAMR